MRESPITSPGKSVFVIEDHPLMLTGISTVIDLADDLEVCGSVRSGKGALDSLQSAQPSAVLLELSLRDCSGLELIRDFRAAEFEPPILVLSHLDETLYAERALRAGANGYLMKKEPTERLIDGIRTVLQGDIYLSERMHRLILKRMAGQLDASDRFSISRLTDRELEIFERIGSGLKSGEIARILGISPKTVDAHRANIKEKLGLSDGAELVRSAVRWVEAGSMVQQHSYGSWK